MKYLILTIALFLTACSTIPETTKQRLIVADWSVTGAANAVADLKPVLSPDNYDKAANVVRKASDALNCAEAAAGIEITVPGPWSPEVCRTFEVPNTPAGYLVVVNRLLLEASAYYAAKGE